MHTCIHQLDVFYIKQPPDQRKSFIKSLLRKAPGRDVQPLTDALESNAICVLALTSHAHLPAIEPRWGIHFIGTYNEFQNHYWDYLCQFIEESPHTHTVAPSVMTLRRHLRDSRKRNRRLTAEELETRKISQAQWIREAQQSDEITPPDPIKNNAKTHTLTVNLNSEQAIQAAVAYTLALKNAAFPEKEKESSRYQVARLFTGLPQLLA